VIGRIRGRLSVQNCLKSSVQLSYNSQPGGGELTLGDAPFFVRLELRELLKTGREKSDPNRMRRKSGFWFGRRRKARQLVDQRVRERALIPREGAHRGPEANRKRVHLILLGRVAGL
jgi:hypothetical protein